MVNAIIYAAIFGIIPCVFWLMFWLREDRVHPEPKRLIFWCFIAGMITTLLVLPLEYGITKIIDINEQKNLAIALWAFIEELSKFLVFYFVAYKSKFDDEAIDNIIYILVIALGFAALENSLFLFSPFWQNEITAGLVTSNLRFIGSTLVHTLCSGIVGIFVAFSFYKNHFKKAVFAFIGLLFATIIHTFFNLSIQNNDNSASFITFSLIWLGIIGMIVIIEKIKTITK